MSPSGQRTPSASIAACGSRCHADCDDITVTGEWYNIAIVDVGCQAGVGRPHAHEWLDAGAAAAAQAAEASPAAWPATDPRWFPPPRGVRRDDATCDWVSWRCDGCGRQCRDLVTRRPARAGEELTVPCDARGVLGWDGDVGARLITFDGGSREIDGWTVAAGAAILWRAGPEGDLQPGVTRTWILPGGADSQEAEAWGGRMAMELAGAELQDGERATIAGDNLAVVRYCAGTGRLLRPELHAVLDPGLRAAACTGRAAGWAAVRRCFNQSADAAATAGCREAAAAAAAGDPAPRLREVRH